MKEDAAAFKARLLKFLEDENISDADVREDTQGECPTVEAYIEQLVHEYFGETERDSRQMPGQLGVVLILFAVNKVVGL